MGIITSTCVSARALQNDSTDESKKERWSIMKNIVLISISFLGVFTAFNGLSQLQSSLHVTEGMGVINFSLLYGVFLVSCLLVPKFLIHLIGHKWTISLSFTGYILWMVANGYAVWATMVPASIVAGLCAAPLWTAQSSYFTLMAARYAQISQEDTGIVVTRFFGIFFFFNRMSYITGSVISSTILAPKLVNNSEELVESIIWSCGAKDCPGNPSNETNLENPESHVVGPVQVWTLLAVYITISICALLVVALAVDQLPKHVFGKQNPDTSTLQLFMATLRHLRHTEQLLIIPITVYGGIVKGFVASEFTKSFISCPYGIWMVGLVTIPFGVVAAVVSYAVGRLVKYTGRLPIMTLGMLVYLGIQITLMLWVPNYTTMYVVFILSTMFGLADGILQTQINGLIGKMFSTETEAAFANYRLWECVGFIVVFSYSAHICTSYKLYILTGTLVIGMLGYYIVEYRIHNSKRGYIAGQVKKSNDKPGDVLGTELSEI